MLILQEELAQELAVVERHILQGERNVTLQRWRVAAAQEKFGRDVSLSRELLVAFERSLALHYWHRSYILRDLRTRRDEERRAAKRS